MHALYQLYSVEGHYYKKEKQKTKTKNGGTVTDLDNFKIYSRYSQF